MAALILFIASLAFFGYIRTFDEEGSAIYSAIAAILAAAALLLFFIWVISLWN